MDTKPQEVHTPAELSGWIRSERHSGSRGRGVLGFGGQREVGQHLGEAAALAAGLPTKGRVMQKSKLSEK